MGMFLRLNLRKIFTRAVHIVGFFFHPRTKLCIQSQTLGGQKFLTTQISKWLGPPRGETK